MFKNNTPTIRQNEIANSVTHAFGIIIAVVLTIILIDRAIDFDSTINIISSSLFGLGMITLYIASTLFHSAKNARRKVYLNRFDHSSIYLLIAATYSPITLVILKGALGWWLFGVIWLLALSGVIFKIWFYSSRYRKLSVYLYLLMGWVFLIFIIPIYNSAPSNSFYYLLAGCLVYSVSTVFYLKKTIPYGHAIFHIFILAGTILHFLMTFHLIK